MNNLTQEQHDLLTEIRDAGARGHTIRQGELCDVMMFGLYGLVEITNSKQPPQRAVITGRGRGFLFRVAA